MSQPKKTYWCLNAVRHDGKRYSPQSEIALTDAEAKPLLLSHAVTRHDPNVRVDPEAEAKAKADAEAEAKAKAEADAKQEGDTKAKANGK